MFCYNLGKYKPLKKNMKFKSNCFFNKLPNFYAGIGVFILFAAFGGNANASMNIPIKITSSTDGRKYYLDYDDAGLVNAFLAGQQTVCNFTQFIEYTGVPATTPCNTVNDIPVYCYKDSVADPDTAWCEFGDCPAGMFAVKTGINIYTTPVGIDVGTIGINLSSFGNPLRYSAFQDLDIAGCVSCSSGCYNSSTPQNPNVNLIKDPAHTGTYNITNCIFPTSFTSQEFQDDSGTFKFVDCLWQNQ